MTRPLPNQLHTLFVEIDHIDDSDGYLHAAADQFRTIAYDHPDFGRAALKVLGCLILNHLAQQREPIS